MRGFEPAARERPGARDAYLYMDALRFFAALAVVLSHARQLVWAAPENGAAMAPWSWIFTQATSFGGEAVMVFFVLSGFWITKTATRQLGSEQFWPRFLTDRLTRLLLVLVPALALGALLDLLGAGLLDGAVYRGGLGVSRLGRSVYDHLTPAVIVGNLLFLQPYAVVPAGTNGPLWSLGHEFWYYLWFAALAVSIKRRAVSPALIVLALGVIWPGLLYLFPVWLVGSLAYYADQCETLRRATTRRGARVFLSVGLAAMAAVHTLHACSAIGILTMELLTGIAFGLVLWGLLRDAIPFPRWLRPCARYGAGASFSLYVTHFPLLAIALAALGYGVRRSPDLASFGLIISLCCLAVAVGWLFSRVTEAHTGRLRELLRLRPWPATRG